MHIDGTTALVSGATGTLGGEVARQLHQRGARLVLTAPHRRGLDTLAGSFEWATAVPCAPSDPDQAAELARRSAASDVVVLVGTEPTGGRRLPVGAGRIQRAGRPPSSAGGTEDQQEALARVVAPVLARRGRGRIVLVAPPDVHAARAHRSASPLAAPAEHRVVRLAAVLRAEMAGTGVGVSTVVPRPSATVGLWPEAGGAPAAPATSSWAVARATVRAIEGDRDDLRPAVPTLSAVAQPTGIGWRGTRLR